MNLLSLLFSVLYYLEFNCAIHEIIIASTYCTYQEPGTVLSASCILILSSKGSYEVGAIIITPMFTDKIIKTQRG